MPRNHSRGGRRGVNAAKDLAGIGKRITFALSPINIQEGDVEVASNIIKICRVCRPGDLALHHIPLSRVRHFHGNTVAAVQNRGCAGRQLHPFAGAVSAEREMEDCQRIGDLWSNGGGDGQRMFPTEFQ